MRHKAGWIGLIALTLLLGWFWRPAVAQFKYAALSFAQTFTALQTFSGGVGIQGATTYLNDATAQIFPLKINFTMTAPAAPSATFVGFGSCSNANIPRFYTVAANQSGDMVSAASPDQVPNDTGDTATVTRPVLHALATHWRALFSVASDGHATLKACNSSANWVAAGTTTQSCNCGAGNPVYAGQTGTGLLTMADFRDGQIRFAQSAPAGIPFFGAGQNRLGIGAASNPTWTRDGGTNTLNLALYTQNLLEVCKAGCQYSSVGAALAAITTNSATNRFTILVQPGDYDEEIDMKSYVALRGVSRETTRIRGIPGNGVAETVDIPVGITDVVIENITLGGLSALASSGTGTPATSFVWVLNSILGITDGTQNGDSTQKSIDCILDAGNAIGAARTWYSIGNLCRSVYDGLRVNLGKILDTGSIYEMGGPYPTGVATNHVRVFSFANQGEIRSTGPVIISNYDQVPSPDIAMDVLEVDNPFLLTDIPVIAEILGMSVVMKSTNSGRTAAMNCVHLKEANLSTAPQRVIMSGTCTQESNSSSGALNGIKVEADAGHANYSVQWLDGRLSQSGGATRQDVDNAETVGGFSLGLSGVVHAGVYVGAGTVSPLDTRLGAFTTKLLGRIGDLVAATCSNNEIALDTGGANKEICICDGGAWACSTVTTATGPTD